MWQKSLPLFFFALLGVSASLIAQNNWKLYAEKDGIQVYTQNLDGSRFKAVKTVCTVDAPLSKLAAVLMDVKNTQDWVYATKTCSLLKQVSPEEVIYYSEVSLPWPARNRDFIISIGISQDVQSKAVTILAQNKPTYLPEKKNIVRIQQSSGKWLITPLNNGLTRIEYVLQVDPGGWLPAWLVNLFAARGPYESFRNLREQVKKPIYHSAQLAFIKD